LPDGSKFNGPGELRKVLLEKKDQFVKTFTEKLMTYALGRGLEVLLPASVPSIVAGLRVSAGLGWQSLIGAELIVASSGIGYLIVKGQSSISTSTVMAGMIAIGAVGIIIDVLLRRAEAAINRRRGREANLVMGHRLVSELNGVMYSCRGG
jgi:ABC-type proline/glycine betaine transport system permease subunit